MGALVFAGAAWRIAQPDPVSELRRDTATTIITQSVVSAPAPVRAPMAEPVRGAYAGNTHTKKFHKKSCRYYSCSNCTAKFATRDEALAAGYSPCGTCDP